LSILKQATQALKSMGNDLGGIAKGMGVVNDAPKHGNFAMLYPYEMPDIPAVSCQSLALIKEEDGTDRCVSCLACEKVCPSQVITIERARNPEGKGFILERFDIDLVNCMYCAACVEACPVSAIVTVQDFELSTYDLQTLKADKTFLDEQGDRANQWYGPKLGVEHRDANGQITVADASEQPGAEADKIAAEEKAALAAAKAAEKAKEVESEAAVESGGDTAS